MYLTLSCSHYVCLFLRLLLAPAVGIEVMLVGKRKQWAYNAMESNTQMITKYSGDWNLVFNCCCVVWIWGSHCTVLLTCFPSLPVEWNWAVMGESKVLRKRNSLIFPFCFYFSSESNEDHLIFFLWFFLNPIKTEKRTSAEHLSLVTSMKAISMWVISTPVEDALALSPSN